MAVSQRAIDEQVAILAEAARGIPEGPGPWHRGAHALVALSHVAPEAAAPLLPTLTEHPNAFVRGYGARASGALARLLNRSYLFAWLELRRLRGEEGRETVDAAHELGLAPGDDLELEVLA